MAQNDTVLYLSKINNSINQIVRIISPQNGSGNNSSDSYSVSSASSLSNSKSTISILSSIAPSVEIVANIKKSTIKSFGDNAEKIFKTLSGINADIKNSAKRKDISEAFSSINEITKGIQELSKINLGMVMKARVGIKFAADVIDEMPFLVNAINKVPAVNPDKMEKVSSSISHVHKILKKSASFILLSPPALAGMILSIPAIETMKLAMLAMASIKQKTIDDANRNAISMSKSCVSISAALVAAGIVVASSFAIGKIVQQDGAVGTILSGFAAISVTLVLIGAISRLAKKTAENGTSDVVNMLIVSGLCIGAMSMIYAARYLGDFAIKNWDDILLGFAFVSGTILLMTGMSLLIGKAAEATKDQIASLMILEGACLGSMIIILSAKYLGDFAIKNWKGILAGLGSVAAVIAGLAFLSKLVGKQAEHARSGIVNMLLIEGVAVVSMGVILAALKISEIADGKWDGIMASIGASAGVITAFGTLAWAAGKQKKNIAIGGAILAELAVVAGMTIGLMKYMIGFHKIKEEAGITWGDLEIDILGASGVIGTFGLLAGVIGIPPISTAVAIGGAILAGLNLVIGLTLTSVKGLIEFHKIKDELNITWGDLEVDMLGIGAVLGTFGGLGTVIGALSTGLLIFQPQLKKLIDFISSTVDVVKSTAELMVLVNSEKIGGAERIEGFISNDMSRIMKCFNKSNFIPGDMAKGELKDASKIYNSLDGIIKSMTVCILDVSVARSAMIAAGIQPGADVSFGIFNPFMEFKGIIEGLSKVDSKKLDNTNKKIKDLVKILSGKDLKELNKNMKSFGSNMKKAAGSMEKFDDALNREAEKRVKNIESFSDALKSVAEKCEKYEASIQTFSNLVVGLNMLDAEKVRNAMNAMNISVTSSGSRDNAESEEGSGIFGRRKKSKEEVQQPAVVNMSSDIGSVFDGATIRQVDTGDGLLTFVMDVNVGSFESGFVMPQETVEETESE